MPRPSTRSTRSTNNRPPSTPPHLRPQTPEGETYLPNLTLLRRNWKWAVFSQFYFTFAQLFAMDDVPISAIEDDLVRSTRVHIPRVMHRLLYALTQDRKITVDSWQSSLRRQYARRDPTSNPIGFEPRKVNPKYILEREDPQQSASVSVEPEQTDSRAVSEDNVHQRPKDEPGDDVPLEADPPELKDWHDLPMLTKLDSINHLVEWMFHNPHRIRTIMRDDDETAQWRIEPIGYDIKRNAYWLIGADRLWIQRSTYKSKNLKRKRLPATKQPTTKETRIQIGKRRKVIEDYTSDSSGNLSGPPPRETETSGPRAAKLNANKKLDAQAKALAEFQRENALSSRPTRPTRRGGLDNYVAPHPPRPSCGTRVSGRLRKAKPDPEDEWQSIPDEWLTEDNSEPLPRKSTRNAKPSRPWHGDTDSESDLEDQKPVKTGLESGESVSDLTDLSSGCEDDPHEDRASTQDNTGGVSNCVSDAAPSEKRDDTKPDDNPEEFIEWEMICSTLSEWERILKRFENATHYSEKALYKLLKNHIVPAVVADLQEIERKKQEMERKRLLEEAVTHRKRSSRIAMKEIEKEEARLMSQKKSEQAEKISRAKRLEMRQQREEAERERKDREQQRRDHGPRTRANAGGRHDRSRETSTASTSHASNDQRSDWELSCEVCSKHTRNQDDGVPIMCCGSCNVWQHIPCHEERDREDGRPPRDWEKEEFYCSRCRVKPSKNGRRASRSRPSPTLQQTKAQLQWEHTRSGVKPSGPAQPPHMGGVPFDRSDYHQMPQVSGITNGGYSYSRPVYNGHSSSLPTSADHQYSSISFSHYQPHQRGFTSRHPQPPIYNSTHYPNVHQPPPTSSIGPIYPTYTNGTGNPGVLSYHNPPGFGGRYRTSTSALPLQNGIGTPNWSFSPSRIPGGPHVATSPAYEDGNDPRLCGPPHQNVQSQYVTLMGPSHSGASMTGGPHSV